MDVLKISGIIVGILATTLFALIALISITPGNGS